jgi:hypothetical protein
VEHKRGVVCIERRQTQDQRSVTDHERREKNLKVSARIDEFTTQAQNH